MRHLFFFILPFTVFVISSCSTTRDDQLRSPASQDKEKILFTDQSDQLLSPLKRLNLKTKNIIEQENRSTFLFCNQTLLSTSYEDLRGEDFFHGEINTGKIKNKILEVHRIRNEMRKLYSQVYELSDSSSQECNQTYRELYSHLLYIEESLSYLFFDISRSTGQRIYPRGAIDFLPILGKPPFLLSELNPDETFSGHHDLKSGDVLFSAKNNSSDFVGRKHFSHLGILHRHHSGEFLVLQATEEMGDIIIPLEKYLEDDQVKIKVMRMEPSLNPLLIASEIFKEVQEFKKQNGRGSFIILPRLLRSLSLHTKESSSLKRDNFWKELNHNSKSEMSFFINDIMFSTKLREVAIWRNLALMKEAFLSEMISQVMIKNIQIVKPEIVNKEPLSRAEATEWIRGKGEVFKLISDQYFPLLLSRREVSNISQFEKIALEIKKNTSNIKIPFSARDLREKISEIIKD